MEWFKSYHDNKIDDVGRQGKIELGTKLHDNKIDDVGRQGKIELDTKLLNEEVDIKNKLFHERLTLLQNR